MGTVSETLNPVSDVALNLHRDLHEWRAQRSTVSFTWEDICLQKRILSDDVRSSNMTDWLPDARWTAITKKQFLFINAACLMEKFLRKQMKSAFISIFHVQQT